MSTTMSPAVYIDAPAPRPPLHSLLLSPDAAFAEPGDLRGGAALSKYPNPMPVGFDPACEPLDSSLREKAIPDPSGFSGEYDVFTAYLGDICTSYLVAGTWEEWTRRAEQALEARTGWALERQLAWGTYADADAFLADADMALPAGAAAVAVRNAIAYLDDWLSQFGQRGVISITPAVATALGFDFFRLDGQQLRTAAGTPVIIGQGYAPNSDGSENLQPGAAGTEDGAEAAAGQSWVFAHPPVKYQVGPLLFPDEPIRNFLDRDDNTVIYRTERRLWVGFDSGPHAGVLADWTP